MTKQRDKLLILELKVLTIIKRFVNIIMFLMRMWRNWQTRKIQVLMAYGLCRFKSCYPHQIKRQSLGYGNKKMRGRKPLFFITFFVRMSLKVLQTRQPEIM